MPFVRLALLRYQPHSLPGIKVSRVAMAEFSQVLPRRRAVVKRNGQSVQVSVHGPVPDRGPMEYHNDSAHLNISFQPPPGSLLESGRNKVYVVLQKRDPNIDSDLAWSDVATLNSGLALPPGATVETAGGAGPIGPLFDQPARSAPTSVTRAGTLGELQAFETEVLVPARPKLPDISTGPVVTIDPAVWQATVTLPALSTQPARLVLREFERYYTDRTVPDKRGNQTFRKRVVEERLVYSEFFPLN